MPFCSYGSVSFGYVLASSPTVAEMPHDASGLSVASIVQYADCKFRFTSKAA